MVKRIRFWHPVINDIEKSNICAFVNDLKFSVHITNYDNVFVSPFDATRQYDTVYPGRRKHPHSNKVHFPALQLFPLVHNHPLSINWPKNG